MARFELVVTVENDKLTFKSTNDGFNAIELVGILESKKLDILNQINEINKFNRTLIEGDGSKIDIYVSRGNEKAIKEKYGEKFIAGKSDEQIVAIYYSLVNRGEIKKNTYDPYKNFKVFN